MNQIEVKRRSIQVYSYLLGLIIFWILAKRIGDNGVAYLAVAIESYAFFGIILESTSADALGKILRGRNAKGQYKNVSGIKKYACILQCAGGIFGTLIMILTSGLLAEHLFKTPNSRFLIIMLAPTLFFRSISAVLLGYFQGEGSELPTVVASILRQIFVFGFGLLFGGILGNYGEKVSNLLGNATFTSMYGGMGIVLAVVLSEVLIVLFLLLVYKGSSHLGKKQEAESMKAMETFGSFVRIFYGSRSSKVRLNLLEWFPIWFGFIFYMKSATDINVAINYYGVYLGKYLVICGVAILPVVASLFAVNAKVAACIRKEEVRLSKSIFQSGLHITVVHTLFYTVFLAVMAKQIAVCFGSKEVMVTTQLLQYGSALIVFGTLAFYFSRLLFLIEKKTYVLGCVGIADIIFIVMAIAMLNVGKAGIMSLVYAGLVGVAVYAILLGGVVCRQLRTGVEWLHTLAIPAGSACVTGLVCLFMRNILTPHLGEVVTIIVCLVLGVMIYWMLLLFLRSFREQELQAMPGGKVIRGIGQMLRVF